MNRRFKFSLAKAKELAAANGDPAEVRAFPNYASYYVGVLIRGNGQWQEKELEQLEQHCQPTAIEIKIGGMFLTCSEEVPA